MSDAVERASRNQRRAADPARSVWVSANAGSGKTRVLTERVARLMLRGAAPETILCLTYTKAAAAEMANRLSGLLGRWALMEDADLARELAALAGGSAPSDAAALAEARRLFAQALETPGGLKIQTIHAFCAALLRRFPLEAGVSPAFEELDDAGRDALCVEIRDGMAEAGEPAFDSVAAHVAEEGMDALIAAILSQRAAFRPAADPARVAAAFGLAEADLGGEEAAADPFEGVDRARLGQAAARLAQGGASEKRVGDPLLDALAAGEAGARDAALAQALCDSKGAPRNWEKTPTKALDKADPWIRPLLADLCIRVEALRERARAVSAARRAVALHGFAGAFLARFEGAKAERGLLDFDDLIERARALLTTADMAPWVLWKLDGGIEHLLVDEAQDTAPAQWEVARALAEAFHEAGPRAGGGARTLFVVGDEKQSIYSFQGADPAKFGEMRDHFERRLPELGAALARVPIETSFRSASAVLRAVDATFEGAAEGLSSLGDAPTHYAAKTDLAGRVDWWPPIPPDPKGEEPDWDAPVDAPGRGDPKVALAEALAAEIDRWLKEGERLPGGGRAIRPGDVMVLVRRRDRLASSLVRALKRRGVAVAGADRLRIGGDLAPSAPGAGGDAGAARDRLAVRDLLALARVALTPEDDLSLAALLRSPLCGLSEDDLFALAHGRPGTLWDALRAARRRFAEALAPIEAARGRADFARPFEFFAAALGEDGGRARLLARLGIEAEEAIDELLAQALDYERAAAPTLEGFLDRIGRSAAEVRREMEQGTNEVRVMTVHGAKGLEAPIVILPDTGAPQGGRPRPVAIGPGGLALWSVPMPDRPAALREAEAARALDELHERRRLLYVAMTRAERWLIVCGAGKDGAGKDGAAESWRGLVRAGLETIGAAPAASPEGVPDGALRVEDSRPDAPAETEDAATPPGPPALPDWTGRRPAPPPDAERRLAASDLAPREMRGAATGRDRANADGARMIPETATAAAAATASPTPVARADGAGATGEAAPQTAATSGAAASGSVGAGLDAAEAARRRGLAVHALLETLPDAPPEDRDALAEAVLARAAPEADAAARAGMRAAAEAAMAVPEAAAAFAPGALAEAAVTVRAPALGGRVFGRIDRLAVEPDRVLAVDFKTDAAPPARPEDAPLGYRLQMAAYREALRALYPERRIELALLYTEGPLWAPLPDAALDAALAEAAP